MSQDPELRAHKEWLGYLQPVGLVVSPAALRDAQAFVNKNIIREQSILIRHVRGESTDATHRGEEPKPRLKDFPAFAFDFWGWEPSDIAGGPGGPELPASLEVPLSDYGEVLAPRYAVPDPANPGSWLMLTDVRTDSTNLDETPKEDANDKRWHASPQARFERLLRVNQVPIGLLVNPEVIRIVYAPRGESTGHLTFPVKAMCEVAGRPIVAALHLLLEAGRLFSLPTNQRLPWILQQSRKYQNEVSTKLAEQILRALNELMRGFQSANEATGGTLLADVLREAPQEVYGGLLTSLLRMVFILYAEDRGLLSNDPIYLNSYSLSGLFERLREDDAQYPDTMDQRFGGWAQFLTFCRLIYDGGGHGAMHLPPRHGRLFDPDAYSFLEGRPFGSKRSSEEIIKPPRVSDGVIFRVLRDLLMLDGERLSYRSLDVEQIGSVYEAMMGFEVRTAPGTSIGLRPDHVVINLSELLGKSPADRVKGLKEDAGCELTGKALEQLKTAGNIEELVASFGRRVSPLYLDERGMPLLVALGGIYLQPTEERRRSGSHYTPRSLTEPIVRTTLEPILKQLGEKPRPEQILDLKICDPAMGSGAFLVEACRFLAEALVESWSVHGQTPFIPPDQEPVLHARRLIAQRCLYGVDKNPFAVDLAKLSLWLATLAKDHPFTFLDHSLRNGDSLVGLTRKQIASFHWAPAAQHSFLEDQLRKRMDRITQHRRRILNARDNVSYEQLSQDLATADESLNLPRMVGDAIIGAFFSSQKPKQREEKRRHIQSLVEADLKTLGFISVAGEIDLAIKVLRQGSKGIAPFHWELEFPEVFSTDQEGHESGGFDAIVGNPPFAGKNTLIASHPDGYLKWLKTLHDESHGNSDLVAHFFRRVFSLLRPYGRFGLIATNTIGQGDTRSTGLRWICTHGGTIYQARKRLKWPGQAAVVVSVVHVCKGELIGPFLMDGRQVPVITAYLFHSGGHEDPAHLKANEDRGFIGSYVLGMGFTFDDTDKKGVATTLAEMERLIRKDARNKERIFPYIGGEEVNDSPTQAHHRYVIDLEDWPLRREDVGKTWADADKRQRADWLRDKIVPLDYPEPVAADYPDLLEIIERKVKPERQGQGSIVNPDRWWMFARPATDLRQVIRAANLDQVIVLSRHGNALAFTRLNASQVFAESLVVIADSRLSTFSVLQSRVHEAWARLMGSSIKDDLRYSPSDCFTSFPFPTDYRTNAPLENAGSSYLEFRAELMQSENKGLTAIYNGFHDPDCDHAGILRLRELHDLMDRAVLDVYGWYDVQPACEFYPEFDEEDENEDDKRPRRKKYRYRWPDEIRDQVLIWLLELNRHRAEEERLACAANETKKPKKRARRAAGKAKATVPTLFAAEEPSK